MKSKFFWNSFFIFLFFSVSLFIVDRFYLFHQAEENVKQELQSMASTIIASEMSLKVLNSYEVTDDVIRDLLENERIDRTIRVFSTTGEPLFFNDLAKSINQPISTETWSDIEVAGRHLKRLSLDTPDYTLEVGLFIDPLLSQMKTHTNQMAFFFILILLISLGVSFMSATALMAPLNKLGQFFVNYNNRTSDDANQNLSLKQDRDFLKVLSNSDAEISNLANGLLGFLDRIEGERSKKQQDLYFLAHELKTPLAQLIFGLESLKGEKEQVQRLLEICKNLSEFIKNYLRIAAIRAQPKESLQISAIKLVSIIKKIELQLTEAEKKRLIYDSEKEMTVFAENQLFESLLQNLISNALKYSEKNVNIVTDNNSIQIIDEGSGFSEIALTNLGQPFNRSSNEESTGLGLTYCFEICRLFNWKLSHERKNAKTILRIEFDRESLPDSN